jgi:hypothetical protein
MSLENFQSGWINGCGSIASLKTVWRLFATTDSICKTGNHTISINSKDAPAWCRGQDYSLDLASFDKIRLSGTSLRHLERIFVPGLSQIVAKSISTEIWIANYLNILKGNNQY